MDIDRLQETLNSMQKGQADLLVKIEEFDQTLTALREELSSSQRKMLVVSQKLDDTQMGLRNKMEGIGQLLSAATNQTSLPLPSDEYKIAYRDYLAGKIDLSLEGFKNFLERYPDHDLSDQAQFFLADCYLTKKKFKEARVEFDKVLSTSLELRAQALLKRSYALAGSGDIINQKATLQALIKEFPKSEEAKTGQQILTKLSSQESIAAQPKRKSNSSKKKARE
ncbi:MAG: hypothetical protein A3I11_04785 [Elusimicrobia bacterium RIFCSPLOWO2_02_FULL_39_32]|nr:MAG: hypothetical protein A3B80_00820 [Elusimicrobia bacterium RIFCSPHIGHO2_02_FULL_39_36]OGR91076.1 MAG: hypothetical protein A3I11_04785 [Elusimicrobia bacterium RIFCSPLOWO2_02_FULL_39_32]OGS00043.1 MAG: hypothetical protein A3G85_07750 [Elusimicrobia bacterium RIFCSPLOWO2_12_FULL_39_28]